MDGIINHHDMVITPEKAAIVKRLEDMRADGWSELESMDESQLDALEKQVDDCAVTIDVFHPYAVARQDAYAAIKGERRKREAKRIQERNRQERRARMITDAANDIQHASRLLNEALAIPYEPHEPAPVPSVDIETATDAELKSARISLASIANDTGTSMYYAALLELVKTDAAHAIRKELQKKSKQEIDRRTNAAELLAVIETEIRRRDAIRAKKTETLEERVKRLESALQEV